MISCILGSKDRFSKLKVLFKSILEQYNEVGIEPDIIVLDGGSKPEVLKFLEETPGVTLIKESMMHGVTRGYNRGFRIAKYPYVTWLSDDQRLEPGFMKAALEHIKTLADNDFIGEDSFIVFMPEFISVEIGIETSLSVSITQAISPYIFLYNL
jgi:hypothetical protein